MHKKWTNLVNKLLVNIFLYLTLKLYACYDKSSMQNTANNCAYIDGANLHKAIKKDGWILDYARFRIWLTDKHQVKNAYLFLGYIGENQWLYKTLEKSGYILIFKEVVKDTDGEVKGNCDADLVFEMAKGYFENTYDKVVLVSSDGDYARIVRFLHENKRLKTIISPGSQCSFLLRTIFTPLTYVRDIRHLVEAKKKKPPLQTKP